MAKTTNIVVTIGLSLILLEVLVLGIGMSNVSPEGTIGPAHYDLQEGDRVSWGIFDIYKENGQEIESFRAVVDAEILANEDLDIDIDVAPDLAIMNRIIIGSFAGEDLDIPMYLDIYTFASIITDALSLGDPVTNSIVVPAVNAIHYISSSSVEAFQNLLLAVQGMGGFVSEQTMIDLLSYLSFFHIGILPETFDYTLLEDFLIILDDLLYDELGYHVFTITNAADELRISITSTTMANLHEDLIANGIFFSEPGVQTSFTMAWDKQVHLLKEVIVTFEHTGIGVQRRVGFVLIRTTTEDNYPSTLDQSSFTVNMEEAIDNVAEIYTIKIAMFILVGICLFNLVILFVVKRNRS